MELIDLQDKIKSICQDFDKDFIFKLLSAYSFPKTTVLKLQKEENHEVVKLKNKLYFKETTLDEDEHVAIDNLSKDKDVLKFKPRFIVVTDYENLVAIDTRKEITDPARTLDIKCADLYKRYDFFAPWLGIESYQVDKETIADIKAANKMAKLYDQIILDNPELYNTKSDDLNVLLSRLLFCFFAEDTRIFEKNIFTNSILSNSGQDGENLTAYVGRIFDVFNIEESKRSNEMSDVAIFPYVNGGLFKDKIEIPKFSRKTRDLLEDCGNLDWSEINPDIFGSMIQAVVHPNQREHLGMHYTSVPNIMKLIRPLFLDDLYNNYFENINNKKKLEELRLRISKIKVFDPACGSGNFLIISYKELCKLEALVLKSLLDTDVGAMRLDLDISFSCITLNNFYGIEIDNFAHEVAKLSLYLAQHQINMMFEKEFGKLKPILPLKESGNIIPENATRIDWGTVCPNSGEIYIVGNPPYLGSRNQNQDQKDDLQFVLKKDYKSLDYISAWFIKGAEYIDHSENAKLAFVSTNSICQGEQVSLLWPRVFAMSTEICFAYQSFKWENNAKNNAGVTVIIVGLSKVGFTQEKKIFIGDKVINAKNINGYLANFNNIFIESRPKPLSEIPEMEYGNMPLEGNFLKLDSIEKNNLIEKNLAVSKFIRPLIGGYEFMNDSKRFCLWIEDKDLGEVKTIPEISSRIENVRKFRESGGDVARTLTERSHQFRYRHVAEKHLIIVPCTSSENRDYLPCGIFNSSFISLNSVQVLYDAEIYIFGILSSRMHMAWIRAVGGRLKTDLRYSSALCYNTFPFPKTTDQQKQIIENQVLNILDEREKYPGKTMAELYDPVKMPYGLRQAHQFLDEVIDRIYRPKPFENDEERLAYLFKLYEEMIEQEKVDTKTITRKKSSN